MKKLVSIIVPVYNAEQYLDACLESILNQTYEQIEIVLVNDGSTDGSSDVCKKWSKQDSRIYYIEQKNAGPSAARNNGIKRITGEYCMFVDADDLLTSQIIENAVLKIEEKNCDMVCWNVCKKYREKEKKEPLFYVPQSDFFETIRAVTAASNNSWNYGRYFRACWGKLYRTDVIKKYKIKFPEDLYIGEDAVFLIRFLIHASKLDFLNEYGYIYRVVETSSVHRYKADLLEQSELQLSYFLEHLSEIEKNQEQKVFLEDTIAVFVWNIFDALVLNEMKIPDKKKRNDASQWYRKNLDFLRKKNLYQQKVSKACKAHFLFRKIGGVTTHRYISLIWKFLQSQKNGKGKYCG